MTPSHTTRIVGAAGLVLSPLLYAASQLTWPDGSEGSNSQVVTLAGQHPGQWYAASLLEAIAAVAGLIGAAVLAQVASDRGRVLARVALALLLGQVVGSVATWVLNAVAVAQSTALPHDRALRAYDVTVSSGYLVPFVALLFLGVLGSLVLLLSAVRARLAPWWVLVVGILAIVGGFAITGHLVAALPALLWVAALAVVARGVLQPGVAAGSPVLGVAVREPA